MPEQKPMGALGMLRVDFHFGIGTSSIYAFGLRSAMAAGEGRRAGRGPVARGARDVWAWR